MLFCEIGLNIKYILGVLPAKRHLGSSTINNITRCEEPVPYIDPGFWRTEDDDSEDDMVYIAPKKPKLNPFIIYETEEETL